MILHATPTHVYHLSDHILDYLKGFLEAKGICTRTVYWNVILNREFQQLDREIVRNPELLDVVPFDDTTIALWKLMTEDPEKICELPENPILSLVFTRKELSQVAHSIKNKIDWYIKENNLHKVCVAGFIMKPREWVMNTYLISRLKDMNPDIKTVVITAADEDQGRCFMKVFPQIDFALWGDTEFPLYYLVEALTEGTAISSVPQVVYRDGDRISSTEPTREPLPDLDSYPFADHTDYFRALEEFIPRAGQVLIPIWGSRSCSWNKCKFCILNKNILYRARSPENIVEEIEYQAEKHNVRSFIFQDSDFAGDEKRFTILLKLLSQLSAASKEPYHFFGSTSSFFINAETAKYLSSAPFDFVYVGFEGVTDTLLEKLQKRNRVAHNIQALKRGRQYGLGMHLNVLRGIPSETEEDILESCRNMKFLRFFFDSYTFSSLPIMLFRKSTFYEEMSEEERKTWNYDRSWLEIAPSGIIPESERFEFFGFYKEESHHRLWDDFDMIVDFFAKHHHAYTWAETENGSVIEEKGLRTYKYTLDRDETDLLVFCDVIRTCREVREQFSHVEEDTLSEMLSTLKEAGLIYFDKNMCIIISTVEACRKGTHNQNVQKTD